MICLFKEFQIDTTNSKQIIFCAATPEKHRLCTGVSLKGFDHQNFHHICVIINYQGEEQRIRVYFDGLPSNEGKVVTTNHDYQEILKILSKLRLTFF